MTDEREKSLAKLKAKLAEIERPCADAAAAAADKASVEEPDQHHMQLRVGPRTSDACSDCLGIGEGHAPDCRRGMAEATRFVCGECGEGECDGHEVVLRTAEATVCPYGRDSCDAAEAALIKQRDELRAEVERLSRSDATAHLCEVDGTPTVAIPTCPKCGEEYLNEEGAAASDARRRRPEATQVCPITGDQVDNSEVPHCPDCERLRSGEAVPARPDGEKERLRDLADVALRIFEIRHTNRAITIDGDAAFDAFGDLGRAVSGWKRWQEYEAEERLRRERAKP